MIVRSPLILDGIEMGELLREGTEIHCEIKKEFSTTWLLHRSALREFMKPYLAEDIITTNNEEDDIHGIRRTKLLGFEETWRDKGCILFMLKTLPFERKHHAPQ